MKQLAEILELGTGYLEKNHIEEARLKMQLLMCHILEMRKIDLYVHFEDVLAEDKLSLIREGMKNIARGIPIQHLIGNTDFMGYILDVSSDVLIPRSETEELVAKAIGDLEENGIIPNRILDIGTGSGCIAIALANKYPNAEVLALDVSEAALAVAENNAARHGADNIVFVQMDILKEFPDGEQFDIVTSNPPYIPVKDYAELDSVVKDHEPKGALTDGGDGLAFYRRFAEIFDNLLAPDGKFYLEIGFGQAEKIINIFSVTKFAVNVSNDMLKVPRIISGKWK
ncbi:MAG: peptide chain release factor N(5)-glutamine methyltransferase [Candidatus Kapabacteria bacterium]|nr:peptide chain release factor N(5)-glutamine methyltransferase [Candidatus Kapabacteria bacterium]